MTEDIERFAEQSVEEEVVAMDEVESDETLQAIVEESLQEMNKAFAGEEEFNPDKAIEELNLDECTVIELDIHLKEMQKLYDQSKEMRDYVRDMLVAISSLGSDEDNEIKKAIDDANLEELAETNSNVSKLTTSDAYKEFIEYTTRQMDGYSKVIGAIKSRLSSKKVAIDTPSKYREDVKIAAERLKGRLKEGEGSRRQERIFDKTIEAYDPDYDNAYLKERATKDWIYLPLAKEALKSIKKNGTTPCVTKITNILNSNLKLTPEAIKSGATPASVIIPALAMGVVSTVETAGLKDSPDDVYKSNLTTIILYVVVKDWIKLLTTGQKKGNASYARVMFSNIIEIGLGAYDCKKPKEEIMKDLNTIIAEYYKGLKPVLPKAWFE